jgi:DNA-binding NarL/FixJ family response regulator
LEPDCDVVAAAADGPALLDSAAAMDPDVLVLDVSLPGMCGIEVASRLKASGARARVVFLTVHADPDYVAAALAAGALGYVVKVRMASDLRAAIREAMAGRQFVSPTIAIGPGPRRA